MVVRFNSETEARRFANSLLSIAHDIRDYKVYCEDGVWYVKYVGELNVNN